MPVRFSPAQFHFFMLLTLCASLFLSASGFAAQTDLVLTGDVVAGEVLSLASYASILEDSGGALTFAEVQKTELSTRFIKNDSDAIGFGFSHAAYWLRFRFANDSDELIKRFFELANFQMSHVDFYQPQADGSYRHIQTGQTQPFSTRAYPNHLYVFPLVLPAHSAQFYYLRVQSDDALTLPLHLWQPAAYHAYERNDYLVYALYIGMVAAMLIFNFLLFIVFRAQVYLLYANLAVSMLLMVFAMGGLGHEFLWPRATTWNNAASFVGLSVAIVAILLFLRGALDIAKTQPQMDVWLKRLIGLQLLLLVADLLDIHNLGFYVEILDLASAMFLTVGIVLVCFYKRIRGSYLIVAGLSMILLGGFVVGMTDLGYLHSNVVTANAIQIGSAFEMILFSLALAERFNWIRLENAKAQSEKITAQQALVAQLKTSEQMLELRVQERTNELIVLNDKLSVMSTTDELTQIANRRRFDEILHGEWTRALRSGQPLSLGMVDVDWFKKYNDHYGHQAGDECLRRVAAVLADSVCRSGDLVARYGGEEFAFIAPFTDSAHALSIAIRICEVLQAQGLPHALSDFGMITASVGVATLVPSAASSPDSLLKCADEALYQAKAQGRNQAVLANAL